ncbi:MAG: hypothetical protein ACHQT9_04935 [Candidatus Saccharimonadales bacterium]
MAAQTLEMQPSTDSEAVYSFEDIRGFEPERLLIAARAIALKVQEERKARLGANAPSPGYTSIADELGSSDELSTRYPHYILQRLGHLGVQEHHLVLPEGFEDTPGLYFAR